MKALILLDQLVSYQISPAIKISAGETSGTLTITGEDDTLYELTESILFNQELLQMHQFQMFCLQMELPIL